ncbi:hypothetical protein [Leifsonia sp. 71-9]|uniref:hypothetical protein n=1 Tax=Leifsonia sp. 71-9 TaxID=1895934 RepID=UPI0025C6D4D6|nr:hypothetical protein [Leifsonia sp. 71-9]
MESLVALTMQVLGNGPAPGGVLSADVLFSRDGDVDRVSSIDEDGTVSITVDARLQHAIEQAVG